MDPENRMKKITRLALELKRSHEMGPDEGQLVFDALTDHVEALVADIEEAQADAVMAQDNASVWEKEADEAQKALTKALNQIVHEAEGRLLEGVAAAAVLNWTLDQISDQISDQEVTP